MEGAGELGASGATCTITLTSAESWNPLTEPVGLKAATGIAGSLCIIVAKVGGHHPAVAGGWEATPHEP